MSEQDIDIQLAAQRSKPRDSHDVTHTQTVGGAIIDNRNQLSTPVMVSFLALLGIVAIGLTIVGTYAGLAVGKAETAVSTATMAERNAKLAQYQLEEAIKKWEAERK